jgi:hypothetical protein
VAAGAFEVVLGARADQVVVVVGESLNVVAVSAAPELDDVAEAGSTVVARVEVEERAVPRPATSTATSPKPPALTANARRRAGVTGFRIGRRRTIAQRSARRL